MDDTLRDEDPDMEKAHDIAEACNNLLYHATTNVPEMFLTIAFLVTGFVYKNFETPEQREGILQRLGDFARKLWVSEDRHRTTMTEHRETQQ